MKISEEFLEYILDLLSPLGDIVTTKMFGGALLRVDGKQLGVLIGDTLYFKVTDTKTQEELRKEGSIQFSYVRKDKKNPVIIKNWWSAPPDSMDDSQKIVEIAEKVLETQS
jgi:DNA transformation protein